jgi:hypothetical protein
MLQKVYFWAKKIHKIVMWAVVIFGSWMMFSGYMMNRMLAGDSTPRFLNMTEVRYFHVTVSMWFLWSLLAQILTGLTIWGVPKLLRRATSQPQQ